MTLPDEMVEAVTEAIGEKLTLAALPSRSVLREAAVAALEAARSHLNYQVARDRVWELLYDADGDFEVVLRKHWPEVIDAALVSSTEEDR